MDVETLKSTSNQARGLALYAIEFLSNQMEIDKCVYDRTEMFLRDSVACAVSAISEKANAPTVLRREAKQYLLSRELGGVPCIGSIECVHPEKAIAADSSAAREWDANGTNFGFNPQRNAIRGEFGHNDFYPVALAAGQIAKADGLQVIKAMICLDEIRGRLAEVFSLKDYKIDHVVHGAIASAAVYGAMLGATVDQIESAIGMTVAHYTPFRAIRAGHQLSDSKGASAAISTEVAVLSMKRAINGFIGPADIFRNPQAIFCLFEPPSQADSSPFDLHLATGGDDFSIMGMHFKIGLYEHQSAGAIHGLIKILQEHPAVVANAEQIRSIRIKIYEPAFSIIGDPAKRNPTTRQSADHSMVYIVATLLRKAFQLKRYDWESLMLLPQDYSEQSLHHPATRKFMDQIEFVHGGKEFDEKYPDGIPTTVELTLESGERFESGLVMYPEGHARNTSGNLRRLLDTKFDRLTESAVDDSHELSQRFSNFPEKNAQQIQDIFDFKIVSNPGQ